jgi:hypothetical protein
MKKVTYLFAMFLVITLMSVSCSKDDNDITSNVPTHPTTYLGKWTNDFTLKNGVTDVIDNEFEIELQFTNAILTAKNNVNINTIYSSWYVNNSETELVLSNGNDYIFTIVSKATSNKLVLSITNNQGVFEYHLIK